MTPMKKINVFFERAINYGAILSGAILVFLTLLITADVTMRYFFNHPLSNVIEMTEHGLLFVTFLGAAWVLKKEKHATVDLLYAQLSPRSQVRFNVITAILGAITCLVMTWFGAQAAIIAFKRGTIFATVWGLPRGPILSIIPIGSFLLVIQFTLHGILNFDKWKRGAGRNTRP